VRVGIDLGTTFSLVANLENTGKPVLLPDHAFPDIYSTPSAVYLNEKNAAVGYLVDTLLEQNPNLPVIRFFKRFFGTNNPLYIDKKTQNQWFAETVAALVLKKLKYDAESFGGSDLESAVITVPAHFNDIQRKSVLNAALMADINVLGLVEEPVAAALHYGITHRSHDNVIAVYDLGGGTFDATVLCLDETGVFVLAKDGLTEVGGKEFDEAIINIILEQFKKSIGYELIPNALTSLQLRRIAEEIKIELSLPTKTYLKKSILLDNNALDIIVHRKEFENAIRNFVEQTIEVTLKCIDSAGFRENDINALMLVGGSSMIPLVKERLSRIITSSKQKIFLHEPMKAVAYGAAMHAAQLSGDARQFNIPPEFRGVTGYNIGVQTINPQTLKIEIDCIIKKNMPLPARNKRTYFTTSNSQSRIVLQVVQYLSLADEIIHIGELTIGPIHNPQLNYPVEVTIENSADGTVKIEAYDPNTGYEMQQVFTNEKLIRGNNLLYQKSLVKNTIISNFSM
jgi:molecular chaperone DnaK